MERTLTEVADGVWVTQAEIWRSNTTIVVDDDGAALVVDPGITVAEVDALAATLDAHGWRVVAGLSTHPHWDHVLWSARLGDVPRFAAPRAVTALDDDLERGWSDAEEAAPGHDRDVYGLLTPLPTLAAALPGTAASLPAPAPDGCDAVLHHGHAPGHLALVTRGVLVSGDMLSDTEVPLLDVGPGGDASRAPADPLADYRQALDALERAVTAYDVEVLVPGHGGVAVGREAILGRFAADRAYLDGLEAPSSATGHSTDARLADPWVAEEHAKQVAFLAARSA